LDEALALGMLLWLAVWWSIACKNYLKLPHAWAIGVVLTTLSLVVTICFPAVLPATSDWLIGQFV